MHPIPSLGRFALTGLMTAVYLVLGSYLGTRIALSGETYPNAAQKKAAAVNVVVAPDYAESISDEDSLTLEKKQYAPVTEDQPMLIERVVEEQESLGAEYPKGTDTFIAPEENFEIVTEPIEEVSADPSTEASPVPTAPLSKE